MGKHRASVGGRETLPGHQLLERKRDAETFNKHSLDAGVEIKYLSMVGCREGIRQQQKTRTFAAMIPEIKADL